MKRLPVTLALLGAAVVVTTLVVTSAEVTEAPAAVRSSIAAATSTTSSTTKTTTTTTKTTTTKTTTTTPPPTTTTPPPPAPVVAPQVAGEQVGDAVRAIEPGAQVGVLAVNLDTGATVASLAPNDEFYTASVVKLLIALDLLHSDGWNPDVATSQELEQMIEYSDDNIADNLWDDDGGNSIVTRMASLIGLPGTIAPDDPTEWGETRMTAADVITTYKFITTQVPEPARSVMVTGLENAASTAADGFAQYFGIPNGLPGTTWGIKQGWMQLDSTTVLDTTGLVGFGPHLPYAVAVMTQLPAGASYTTGSQAVTAGAAALKTLLTN